MSSDDLDNSLSYAVLSWLGIDAVEPIAVPVALPTASYESAKLQQPQKGNGAEQASEYADRPSGHAEPGYIEAKKPEQLVSEWDAFSGVSGVKTIDLVPPKTEEINFSFDWSAPNATETSAVKPFASSGPIVRTSSSLQYEVADEDSEQRVNPFKSMMLRKTPTQIKRDEDMHEIYVEPTSTLTKHPPLPPVPNAIPRGRMAPVTHNNARPPPPPSSAPPSSIRNQPLPPIPQGGSMSIKNQPLPPIPINLRPVNITPKQSYEMEEQSIYQNEADIAIMKVRAGLKKTNRPDMAQDIYQSDEDMEAARRRANQRQPTIDEEQSIYQNDDDVQKVRKAIQKSYASKQEVLEEQPMYQNEDDIAHVKAAIEKSYLSQAELNTNQANPLAATANTDDDDDNGLLAQLLKSDGDYDAKPVEADELYGDDDAQSKKVPKPATVTADELYGVENNAAESNPAKTVEADELYGVEDGAGVIQNAVAADELYGVDDVSVRPDYETIAVQPDQHLYEDEKEDAELQRVAAAPEIYGGEDRPLTPINVIFNQSEYGTLDQVAGDNSSVLKAYDTLDPTFRSIQSPDADFTPNYATESTDDEPGVNAADSTDAVPVVDASKSLSYPVPAEIQKGVARRLSAAFSQGLSNQDKKNEVKKMPNVLEELKRREEEIRLERERAQEEVRQRAIQREQDLLKKAAAAEAEKLRLQNAQLELQMTEQRRAEERLQREWDLLHRSKINKKILDSEVITGFDSILDDPVVQREEEIRQERERARREVQERAEAEARAKEQRAKQKAAEAEAARLKEHLAKKQLEKEAEKKSLRAKLKQQFSSLRRKKLRDNDIAIERRTAVCPLSDTRYMLCDRGEEFDILREFPDGTVTARRVETGETGLLPLDVFIAMDSLI